MKNMETIKVVGHPYGEKKVVEMEVAIFEALDRLSFLYGSGTWIMYDQGGYDTGEMLKSILEEVNLLNEFLNEKQINKEWKRTTWIPIKLK